VSRNQSFPICFALLLSFGCSGSSDTNPGPSACPAGSERCACYGNGTCNTGLECRSKLCVSAGNGGGTSGGTSSAGGPSSGGTTTAGGANPSGGTSQTGGATVAGGTAGMAGVSSGGGPIGGAVTGGATNTGGLGALNSGGASAGGTPAGGSAMGGMATGGTPTGGVVTGGTATGGTSTGGAVAGGSTTGGAATGGIPIGGVPTGGVAVGGVTGGAATGGALPTGGFPTGGAVAAGGMATGGTATGGLASGGAPAGGAATGGTATGGSTGCVSRGGPSMVPLPQGYCIDSTEVTRAQYAAWLATTPSTAGQNSACTWNASFTPDATCMSGSNVCQSGCDDHPQVCVDWCDAYAYCQGMGKRLCGRIGGGANGYAYYADVSQSQWYNACTSHDPTVNLYVFGPTYSGQVCNGPEYPSGTTVMVGSLIGCQSKVSGYQGVYDLNGNVWEWEDSCDGGAMQAGCRIRGGSFAGSLSCGIDASLNRIYPRSTVGFRCCSNPPAGAALAR
jgi:sulfatase modifying factor 1